MLVTIYTIYLLVVLVVSVWSGTVVNHASAYTYYLPAGSPSSQYSAQDEIGQYNYGYNSADQSKSEVKTADGVVRGTYGYVDANGLVQTTNYISDALGFRVAATNLPVHDVDGPAAPVQVALSSVATAAAEEEAAPVVSAAAAPVVVPQVSYAYLPYASNYGYHTVPPQHNQTNAVIQAASIAQDVQVSQTAPSISQPAAAIPAL